MGSSRRGARRLLAILAAVALLAGCAVLRDREGGVAPIAGTSERDRVAERSQLSDEAVTALIPETEPGCVAAVAVEGSIIWEGAGGLFDTEKGTRLTTETRFDIASVSKQFTATAILMLQREGLLSVSDPVGKYVKDLPSWGSTVTLDQLIHHTSRIPDFWTELDDMGVSFLGPADQQTTLQAIRRLTTLETGKGYVYTNANYVLLAEVVRRVSGESLPHFLAQRVFAPLGLDMAVAPASHAAGIATPYGDDLNVQWSGWSAYGHTGIISTAATWPAGATSTAPATSSRRTSPSERSTRARTSSTPPGSTSRWTATSITPGTGAATSRSSPSRPTARRRSRSSATGISPTVSGSLTRSGRSGIRRRSTDSA